MKLDDFMDAVDMQAGLEGIGIERNGEGAHFLVRSTYEVYKIGAHCVLRNEWEDLLPSMLGSPVGGLSPAARENGFARIDVWDKDRVFGHR